MLGIEIWSAREGLQRFESHADKLINYIRYWQASGESLKIAERTKTRMQQLTSEGFYCGGRAPYGYRLVKTGRVNPGDVMCMICKSYLVKQRSSV